jgi:hypothetical protein
VKSSEVDADFGQKAGVDLLDDCVSAKQESFWDFEPKRLCRVQINDEFEGRRLFDREIGRFSASKDFVHGFARVPKQSPIVRSVRH